MSYNHFLLFFSALKASTGSNIHRASSKWAPGRYAEYGVVADIGTRIRPQGCDIRANSEDHKHSNDAQAKIPEVYALSGVSLVGK